METYLSTKKFHFGILCMIFLVLTSLGAAQAQPKPPLGSVRITAGMVVVDGDTLKAGAWRIRLWGISAPELGTPGGAESAKILRDIIGDDAVTCGGDEFDRYMRLVAICGTSLFLDLGESMVKRNAAKDWPKYSGGYYAR